MSESRRVQRVEKELREIVASYVIRHCTEDLLSVTQVKVSKDLRQARVYVSVVGASRVSDEKLDELQEHGPEIQHQIAKRLRMKYCPKLKFFNDESVEMNEKVDEILAKMNTES